MNDASADRERLAGRRDTPETLLLRLPTAGVSYLEGALENPGLGPAQVLQLLRNHRAPATVLARLGEDEALARQREVRIALASHPVAPRPLALHLVSLLGWRDLVTVSQQPRTPAPVKRRAEMYLGERLEGLSLGEQITLARMAPRGVLPALRALPPHPRVVGALLENPRAAEGDVIALLRGSRLTAEVIGVVAGSARWMGLPTVRRAIALHGSSRPADALRCLQGLPPRELRLIAGNPQAPPLVRRAAERLLKPGSRGV
jgi:hypothetical protein